MSSLFDKLVTSNQGIILLFSDVFVNKLCKIQFRAQNCIKYNENVSGSASAKLNF